MIQKNEYVAKIISEKEMDTFIPKLDSIFPFLVQVRMCLVVIGGEIYSKMETVLRNRDSSFL